MFSSAAVGRVGKGAGDLRARGAKKQLPGRWSRVSAQTQHAQHHAQARDSSARGARRRHAILEQASRILGSGLGQKVRRVARDRDPVEARSARARPAAPGGAGRGALILPGGDFARGRGARSADFARGRGAGRWSGPRNAPGNPGC